MTRQQFDETVDLLIRENDMPDDEPERDFYVRMLVASGFSIRDRRGIPDNVDFTPTPTTDRLLRPRATTPIKVGVELIDQGRQPK